MGAGGGTRKGEEGGAHTEWGTQKVPQGAPTRAATASLAMEDHRALPPPSTMHSLGAGPIGPSHGEALALAYCRLM